MRPILVTVLLALAAGCAGPETNPPEIAKVPPAAQVPAKVEPLACPPAPKPQCPALALAVLIVWWTVPRKPRRSDGDDAARREGGRER